MRFVTGVDGDALGSVWPRFLTNDRLSNRYWNRLYTDFPDFQFRLVDGDRVLAQGNSVPVRGMPLQWRDAFPNAFDGEGEPDRLCALAIIVAPELQGTGLSSRMLAYMRELAAPFGRLVAPVRPTWKERQPRMPIEEYVALRREDGTHVDPWIRTHERAGGRILGPADGAMEIEGNVDEWQEWTGLDLPADGEAIVPGALVPVRFEHGHGTYREPCVWIDHRVE